MSRDASASIKLMRKIYNCERHNVVTSVMSRVDCVCVKLQLDTVWMPRSQLLLHHHHHVGKNGAPRERAIRRTPCPNTRTHSYILVYIVKSQEIRDPTAGVLIKLIW